MSVYCIILPQDFSHYCYMFCFAFLALLYLITCLHGKFYKRKKIYILILYFSTTTALIQSLLYEWIHSDYFKVLVIWTCIRGLMIFIVREKCCDVKHFVWKVYNVNGNFIWPSRFLTITVCFNTQWSFIWKWLTK